MNVDMVNEYRGLFVFITVAFGLIFGSFASVLALRIPDGKSVVTPPSQCPNCDRELSPWENIPLLSFLILRSRCRSCHQSISFLYPAMEMGTAALYVMAVFAGGITPLGLAYTGFAVITLPLLLIDLKYRRLPNILTYSGFMWSFFACLLAGIISEDFRKISGPFLTALACASFFLILNLLSGGGMGMGDVKLAGVIGITLGIAGWKHAVFAIALGFIVGGIAALVLLLLRRVKIGATIPFGPSMLIGAWLAILLGPEVARQFLLLWSL